MTSVELGINIFMFIDEDKRNTKADRQLESLEKLGLSYIYSSN